MTKIQNPTDISRRKFMALAGGAAGLAAMAAMGLSPEQGACSVNVPEMDTKNWNAWINISKGRDGKMMLEKQPLGSWPA